jgi:hypothetical protein
MRKSEHRFYGKLNHTTPGYGYVSINYDEKTDDEDDLYGLWVSGFSGHLGCKNSPEGQWSFAWRVPEPFPELLMTAAQCALGLMPPAIFADWLDDRRGQIEPLLFKFEDETRNRWERATQALRDLSQPIKAARKPKRK